MRAHRHVALALGLALVCAAAASSAAAAPVVRAPSAILLEASGGKVLWEKDADRPLPIASLTKIMTMTLVLEALRDGKVTLDDVVVGSALARSMGGTQIWLEEGEQMSLRDMLYAVAVGSANDCAVALAEHVAGSVDEFVRLMNQRAAQLGMTHTHFANPTGLDAPDNYSTARDLALLSRYAVTLPLFLELTSTWDYYVRKGTPKEVWLTTFNKLLKQYPGYDGIKTGFTDTARYCLAATAKRDGLRLIAVVLGAPTAKERTADVRALLDYGFRAYEAVKVLPGGSAVASVEVWKGAQDRVDAVAAEDVYVVVPRGQRGRWQKEVVLPKPVVAPVKKGQVVGVLVFTREGEKVAEVPLVAAAEVPRGNVVKIFLQTTRQLLRSLFRR
ncbi:MAG: D-alanyl-D-alanine carboxypeptidase family protein [Bacillota bacterium]|nr:D-alanyl-D-alanine carboxypeptidase family protein [Bacillota bacterium]